MMEVEQEEDEPPIICTIRRKRSIITQFWDLIQSEYAQDELVEEEPLEDKPVESVKRKREDDSSNQQIVKLTKKKKTMDIPELSNFMKNFLNIQEKRRFNNNMMREIRQNIKAMEQDHQEEEEQENLTRPIKTRLTVAQSNMLILKITNELLYS